MSTAPTATAKADTDKRQGSSLPASEAGQSTERTGDSSGNDAARAQSPTAAGKSSTQRAPEHSDERATSSTSSSEPSSRSRGRGRGRGRARGRGAGRGKIIDNAHAPRIGAVRDGDDPAQRKQPHGQATGRSEWKNAQSQPQLRRTQDPRAQPQHDQRVASPQKVPQSPARALQSSRSADRTDKDMDALEEKMRAMRLKNEELLRKRSEAEEDEKAFTEVARAEAEQAAEHRKAEEARLARAKKLQQEIAEERARVAANKYARATGRAWDSDKVGAVDIVDAEDGKAAKKDGFSSPTRARGRGRGGQGTYTPPALRSRGGQEQQRWTPVSERAAKPPSASVAPRDPEADRERELGSGYMGPTGIGGDKDGADFAWDTVEQFDG